MKTLIKYISALLFGGLIILFFACSTKPTSTCIKVVPQRDGMHARIPCGVKALNFYFYNSVIKKLFPALKNLD